MFGVHWFSVSGDITYLICHVTSLYVATLQSLLILGIVVVEMCF